MTAVVVAAAAAALVSKKMKRLKIRVVGCRSRARKGGYVLRVKRIAEEPQATPTIWINIKKELP
jgi:hypothetical protein